MHGTTSKHDDLVGVPRARPRQGSHRGPLAPWDGSPPASRYAAGMEPPETDPRPLARFCLQSGLLPPDLNSAPGTGISRAETLPPKVDLRGNAVSAETQTPIKSPASQRVFGGFQEPRVFAKVRGGGRSRSRTSLHLEFPANREKNREFFDFGLFSGSCVPASPMNSGGLSEIPCATEQGISFKEQGNVRPDQGIVTRYSIGQCEWPWSLKVAP